MFKNFSLKQKFTVLLLIILVVGLSLSGLILSSLLRQNATNEVASKALALIDTMSSVRQYTVTQITPELSDKLQTKFLPQTVAGYSAREVFDILRQKPEYRDFFYKEATLNPTNLRDKADSFESTVVNRFRNEKDLKQLSGFRSTPGGDIFYIARPLPVSKTTCLECHGKPENAPKTMIDQYGTANGFGWQMNEIVAAQIIAIPASKVLAQASQSSFLIVGLVSAIFVVVILLVNFFLNTQVVRPLKHITRIAEEVSTGHMEAEFEQLSNDEIGKLARAFKRMQLSLQMAMKRIKRTHGNTES
jgi:HAMP domain-containing protein